MRQILFIQHHGAAACTMASALILVLVGCGGKGHQQGRLSAAASSATVDAPLRAITRCACEARGHIVKEGAYLPARCIRATGGIGCPGTSKWRAPLW